MAIVQTDALVVRSHRLGETSLIVTLFTRDCFTWATTRIKQLVSKSRRKLS